MGQQSVFSYAERLTSMTDGLHCIFDLVEATLRRKNRRS